MRKSTKILSISNIGTLPAIKNSSQNGYLSLPNSQQGNFDTKVNITKYVNERCVKVLGAQTKRLTNDITRLILGGI